MSFTITAHYTRIKVSFIALSFINYLPDGEDDDSVLQDFIVDEDTVSPEDSASNQLLKEQVQEILSSLSDREQKIVRMRFGLDNGKNHTLEEVGQEFAVTRERIRQIEAKALAKLRKHKDAKKLYEYLD